MPKAVGFEENAVPLQTPIERLGRLRRRFQEITTIDFFNIPSEAG